MRTQYSFAAAQLSQLIGGRETKRERIVLFSASPFLATISHLDHHYVDIDQQKYLQNGEKHRNASPRMIKFATATAIANYNAGYLGSNFNHLLGIDFTTSMETYLKERDNKMDSPIRRKMRKKFIRKALEDYAAGGF